MVDLAPNSQYFVPTKEPDVALRLIFPNIPDDARRFLRKPLQRWHAAAVRFVLSEQSRFDDLRFAERQLKIFVRQPPERRAWVSAMYVGLKRAIDAELTGNPEACRQRYSCALQLTLEKLFGPERGN